MELPERSRFDPAHPRSIRRRRSVSRWPALVDPIDLPEDAPGRVELFSLAWIDDDPPDLQTTVSEAEAAGMSRWDRYIKMNDGWVMTAAVGGLMLIVFVLGMLIFR